MSSPPTPPRPLYWRIAFAVTAAVLVAIVGIAATGLTRFYDARDHRIATETRVAARADTLALLIAAQGTAVAMTAGGDLAAVEVVTAGLTDEFGISVGSEIAVDRIIDPLAHPGDPADFRQKLLNRSATYQDHVEKGLAIPSDLRFAMDLLGQADGSVLFSAFAPIMKDKTYTGMAGVWERVLAPPSSVPTSRLVLFVALALLLGFFVSHVPAVGRISGARIGLTLATIIPVFSLFLGQSLPIMLLPTLFAALLGFLAGPGISSVFRGFREQPTAYVYIVPAMIGMLVLVFVPFIMGVALSFFSGDNFSGLANFKEILAPAASQHPTFYWTLGFTVLWTVANVVLHVSIGLALALVLNRPNLRLKGIYRMLLIVPWAVPNYITALIWKGLFSSQSGAVNALLDVFGIEPVNWLGPGSGFWTNFFAALTTNTWLGFPFMMVVTLGALQSIPKDLYEAADIDGAGRWQKFVTVTLPLLKPALVPAVILGVIWTFNMFNVIYLVSGGGPANETNILITEAYYAFKVLHRNGLAAAYSLLIFFILLAYGWMQNRVTRATEGAFE